ncbi:SUZ domain-containing protein [Phanerochaete sordida]|uniref:SUZ domain-containing protein n=1 Tax=Phanerochaete sordida TaxID=48140 RepID=A0A9P3LKT9_9APHY|nr:SUZ domain-containing protein [Phanerochaete sordida]
MSATTPSDSWDSPSTEPQGAVAQRQSAAVKDDWDDSDDSEPDEDPQKVWDDANRKAPMPELVIAPTSASAAAVPAQALQPAMRILKRPSAPTSPAPVAPAADAQRSLAEREAQYRAARERIFGSAPDAPPPADPRASASPASAAAAAPGPSPSAASELSARPIRNPRGPDSAGATGAARGAGPSRGFRGANPRNASARGRPT